jgi:hypothetical protein
MDFPASLNILTSSSIDLSIFSHESLEVYLTKINSLHLVFPVDDNERADLLKLKLFDFFKRLPQDSLYSAYQPPDLPVFHNFICVEIVKVVELAFIY